MKIFKKNFELSFYLRDCRAKKRTIGFVPTMGALHEGHLALLKKAKKENDITVCSIFVNPTQFNNKEDLKKYPRTLGKDISLLKKVKCNVLFAPDEEEMYPENDSSNSFKISFGNLDKVMEGKFRSGHFKGVATIVNKLFIIVEPHKAYFGEKDFQQLLIIKKMVEVLKHKVKIIPCETVREKDGLAMSSRNMRLTKEERKMAPFIYKILFETKLCAKKLSVRELKNRLEKQFAKNKKFRLEYFEIADAETLTPLKNWGDAKTVVACVAVYLGSVRLIDNIKFFQ